MSLSRMSFPELPDTESHDDPCAEPTVDELLLARINEHCRLLGLELARSPKPASSLHPSGRGRAGTPSRWRR
jgi:hypothetical protein